MSTPILNLTVPEAPSICPAALSDPRSTHPLVEQAWRDRLVREAAYFRSLRRQPCPGKELEDWVAAEREIDQSLGRVDG